MPQRNFAFLAPLVFACACASNRAPETETRAPETPVQILKLENKLRIDVEGQLFTEYHFQGAPHLYYYPIVGPSRMALTRNAPMREVEGEERDHPHHRSLWFAHGDVNGVDFWSESPKAGKIVHDKFLEIKSGNPGRIVTENKWVAPDGKVVCRDQTTFQIRDEAGKRLIDFNITLRASEGTDITLGDTKEGTMAIRLAESMRLKPNKFNTGKPTGHIVQNTGVRDDDTWGKRADWCDYYGPVDGKIVGVAILDHPKNPRHPTWWHVRDYGLFAANPFGLHEFEKKPEGAGNLVIPAGSSITFRYRIVLHDGDEKAAGIAALYSKYAAEPVP